MDSYFDNVQQQCQRLLSSAPEAFKAGGYPEKWLGQLLLVERMAVLRYQQEHCLACLLYGEQSATGYEKLVSEEQSHVALIGRMIRGLHAELPEDMGMPKWLASMHRQSLEDLAQEDLCVKREMIAMLRNVRPLITQLLPQYSADLDQLICEEETHVH